MIKLLLNTRRTITKSYSQFYRLLSSTILTYSDGFFLLIPLNVLGDKTTTWLFIYYEGGKIISSYKFIGKGPYKNFNKFINKTLSGNPTLTGEPKKVWVPKNFVSKKTKEIWSYQNLEFIPYSNYDKKIPNLLRLIRTNIKNISLSNPSNDLNNIVNSVNTMISPLTLLNSIKVGTSIINQSNKTIKRMYSTITGEHKSTKNEDNGLGWDEKLLSLEKGDYEYLENRYPSIEQVPDTNVWFDSDPYIYKTLGPLGQYETIKTIITNVIKSLDLGPHSILFIVRTNLDLKYLDKQFLINKDTDIDNLISRIYERVDLLTLNYNFNVNDILSCKHRRLRLKEGLARDHFKLGEMQSNGVNIDSNTNLGKIKSKFLSPKFVPYSMNLSKYGKVILNDSNNVVTYNYNGTILRVTIHERMISHSIQVLNKNKQVICEIDDEKFDDYFIRSISSGDRTTYLKISHNSKLLNKEYELRTSFLKPIPKEKRHNLKILTFDIETYLNEYQLSIPYACGFYDGKKYYKYYLTSYKNSEEMLLDCINAMLVPKYYGYTVYVHNLSKFDVYFIHRLLHINFTVSGIIAIDKDIISFTVSGVKSKLVFRDSIRLLPDTLKNLGKSFNVKVTKGIYPYLFVNKDNLKYKGPIPPYNYYNQDIETENAYKKLLTKNKVWDLKNETLKYHEKDLISLYQIMTKMSNEIWVLYSLNITKYSTISSLGMAIYLSNFISKEGKISRAKGELERCIREGYYGGAVDVYVPYAEDAHYYDANSLYPEAMLNAMPVGIPIHSLNRNLNELFGFVKATVTTPDNNYAPLLPYKLKTPDGYRLIFPNGTWTAWFFSEELKYVVNNHDYKVEVHESYLYEKGYNLFNGYVDQIGAIKQSSTGARRHIHKLLLNCLYGRMGMRSDRDVVKTLTPDQVESILLTHHVVENFKLTDNKEYIRYKSKPDRELCAVSGINYEEISLKSDESYEINSSPAIAAAVTAYARIKMNPLKSIAGNRIFYSDTDSAILPKPLPGHLIGNKIGQFKLEYPLIKKGYFISPKLYILELEDGNFVSKSKGYSGKLDSLDYLELYKGGMIKSMNKRWKKNLKLGSVKITDQTINISSNFNKRNKLYSLGKWVDTSPLCVHYSCIVSLDLVKFTIKKDKNDVIYLLPAPQEYLLLPAPDQIVIILPVPLPSIIYVSPPLPTIVYAPGPRIYLLSAPDYLALPIVLSLPTSPNYLALPLPNNYLALPLPNNYLSLAEPTCSQTIIYLPGPIDPYHSWY